jgi:hypothetical protein
VLVLPLGLLGGLFLSVFILTVAGDVERHDPLGALPGGVGELGEEVVVAAAVVDGQRGSGQPGGVLRLVDISVRVGVPVVDQRLHPDPVTADRLGHAPPHVRGRDHGNPAVVGRIAAGVVTAAGDRERERHRGGHQGRS